MDFNKRTQDLTEVFDRRWKVNNDYEGRKKLIDSRKEHFNKMFNIKDNETKRQEILKENSVNGQVNRLNLQMKAVNDSQRFMRMNEFKNKFK